MSLGLLSMRLPGDACKGEIGYITLRRGGAFWPSGLSVLFACRIWVRSRVRCMLEFLQKRHTTRDLLALFLVEDVGKTWGVVNRGWECGRSPILGQHELQLECTVRRLTIASSRSTAATGRRLALDRTVTDGGAASASWQLRSQWCYQA